MLFWVLATATVLLVGLFMVLALTRRGDDGDMGVTSDVQVYRAQLREIDRDLARGTLVEEEAERMRV